MQLRGPVEKGCEAWSESPAYSLFPGSQRSGAKVSGLRKFLSEWEIAHVTTEVLVYLMLLGHLNDYGYEEDSRIQVYVVLQP
jgi:hypothetical protein